MNFLSSRKMVLVLLLLCGSAAGAALWARQQPSVDASAADIEHHVEAFLRAYFAWGKDFQVKVDAPAPSPVPDLYEVPVEVTLKGQSDKATVYVSRDGRFILRGTLDKLVADPFASNRALLHLENHPFIGPADACVNVVEFSDFECPHCRELYQVLKQVEFRYPQVRFTFVDFPLVQIHPWAMTAALIARCAFQQTPTDYPKLQQSFFEHQAEIDQAGPANASSKLLDIASQAGFGVDSLRVCLASSATRKLVDVDLALAKQLSVNSTPTLFINGRPLIGANGQLLDQLITYESEHCPSPL
ncbi:MAG TPA: thioredoxin domain-containing protein [Candidatus Acidoferrales bacterium]|nr:thioredoxin domain-containing protein [Candidatus Acidoferrales bacterium]